MAKSSNLLKIGFTLLEARAYELLMKYQEAPISVNEDDIAFWFAEKMKKVDKVDRYGYRTFDLVPTLGTSKPWQA